MLTTAEHRKQYEQLAVLMREGASAGVAVPGVFGVALAELTDEFERGAWRKDVSYRIAARDQSLGVVSAVEMDAAAVDAQLRALQALVAEIGDL